MTENRSVLIVSGGIEALPGIQIAKKMGLQVIVSDMDINAPGFQIADDRIIASTYDIEKTTAGAVWYNKNKRKVNGVICIASDVPLTVATVAKTLGLPGISIKSAWLATDKLAMKEQFQSDKIPIPEFTALSSLDELKRITKEWGFPLVIKPIDSRGARGVLRLTDKVDLEWAWTHSIGNSPTGRIMVEKFLEGPQVSTESMMIDGQCYTPGFSDRNYEHLTKYAPHIIENGGDLPSQLPQEIQNAVKSLIKKAALSIGIKNGIVKGDIVVHRGKPYIIELAVRLSGGYFCTHTIPMNTGVKLVENAIKLAVGEKVNPKDLEPKFYKPICQRYIFPKPGEIKKINGLDRIKNNMAIKFADIRIKPGDIIENINAHPSRAGMIITEGNSRLEAQTVATNAIESLEFIYQ